MRELRSGRKRLVTYGGGFWFLAKQEEAGNKRDKNENNGNTKKCIACRGWHGLFDPAEVVRAVSGDAAKTQNTGEQTTTRA